MGTLEEISPEDLNAALIELLEEEKIIAQCVRCETLLTAEQLEDRICECGASELTDNDIRVYARESIGKA